MSTVSAPSHARFHLVFPLLLIGVGVVLLLIATGALAPEVAGRLVSLWPLLLVMVGVELIVERTAPNAVGRALAALLIVVVALAGVAWAVSGIALPTRAIGSLTGSPSAPATATLTVNARAARISVDGSSIDSLYRVDYALGGGQPDVTSTGSAVTVSTHREWMGWSAGDDRLDVHINPGSAWNVNLNVGAAATSVDLSALNVSSLMINGGAGSVTVKLGRPSGTVPIEINGGAMSATIQVPPGVQAQVVSRGAMSSFSAPGAVAGIWRSPGYTESADRYSVTVVAAMASVRVVPG